MRFALLLLLAGLMPAAEILDLAGTWSVALDRTDVGLQEGWATWNFPATLTLPGSLQAQGFGDDPREDTAWTANVMDRTWWTSPAFAGYRQPGNVKMPCWLTPRKHYVGVAWYRRDIEVPAAWAGKRLELSLERVHWTSRVWVDGRDLGTCDSLSTAHVYDLGTLPPGRHVLSLRIDNRMLVDVGNWAHSVSDHTQGNWNGVIGALTLRATSPVWIRTLRTWPDIAARAVRLEVDLGNAGGQPGSGRLRAGAVEAPVTWTAAGGRGELTVPLGAGAGLWDEFQPTLHHLEVALTADGIDDRRGVDVGLRQLGTSSSRLLTLNGRDIFLRGTLECCIFPATGYPPTDVAAWERIMGICRNHGLNHLRFHSWCPPEAAFTAADRLGFYLQVEVASWCQVGKGKPIDAWIGAETERILAAHGNHPSFLLLLVGNEMLPYGADADRDRYLTAWSRTWSARDPRRLYAGSTLTTSVPTDQFRVASGTYGAAIWPQGDYRGAGGTPLPHLVHEMGQYCVFPDFSVLDRPAGFLQPKNFEIFRESLVRNGLAGQAKDFLRASGKLQALCYKEDIEAVLRTPGVAGFQLLDLHDFPGQGTALVGVLDAEWREKGYITSAEYRRFAGPTVPLVKLPRVITADQALDGEILVAHQGAAPLTEAQVIWRITDAGGTVLAHGELPRRTLTIGRHADLGRISVPAGALPASARYRVEVAIAGTAIANSWDLTVLSAEAGVTVPAGVELATRVDPELVSRIAAGGTVVLCHPNLGGADQPPGAFVPVFWNRQWFPSQKTQTLGLLCDPGHPALAGFPTLDHTDFLWRDVLETSGTLNLAEWSAKAPLVQWIDDWNTNRPLALVAECRIGQGRLVAAAIDAVNDLEHRPATRQLLRSLLAYAATPRCAPAQVLTEDAARRWIQVPVMANLGARARADSAHGKYPADHLVDGRRQTMWHTDWKDTTRGLPHRITVTLQAPLTALGLRLWPRQDEATRRAKDLVILDDQGQVIVAATAADQTEASEIRFPRPMTLQAFTIEVRSTWDGDPNVAFAECEPIPNVGP